MKVSTSLGLIDRIKLDVNDIVTNEANSRTTATEWYLNGTLVRRDVWVNLLNGMDLNGQLSHGS